MRRRVVGTLAAVLLAAAPADPARQGVALYRAGQWREAAAAFGRSADPVARYDLGCALARAGNLSGALAAFDAALRESPEDADARANRALMLRLLAAAPSDPPVAGRSGAAGTKVADREVGAPKTPADSTGAEGLVGTRRSRSAAMANGLSSVAPPRAAAPDAGHGPGGTASGNAAAGAGEIGRGHGLAREAPAAPGDRAQLGVTAWRERAQATEQWIATIDDDPAKFLRLRLLLEQAQRQAAGVAMPPGGDPW